MADLQSVALYSFENFQIQWDTTNSPYTSGDRTVPLDHLTVLDPTGGSGLPPVVLLTPVVATYQTKGIQSHPDGGSNSSGAAIVFDTSKKTLGTNELISFIRMRTFGNTDPTASFDVGPAVRVQDTAGGGILVGDCYSVEVVRSGGSGTDYNLSIVKYSGGVRSVLATLSSAITQFPAASGNFNNRFYAIGLQATNSGSNVILNAFLILLYFTEIPSTATIVNLENLTGSYSSVLSHTDTGAAATAFGSGYHGIKWRPGLTVSTHKHGRLVSQWGLFKDMTSLTRPGTPVVSATEGDNGQRIAVTLSSFTSSAGRTHQSTRWLLYDDEETGSGALHCPVIDTGYLAGNLLSYTFSDLSPGKQYNIRVQFKDDQGGVSAFGNKTSVICTDMHLGYGRAISFYDNWLEKTAPTNRVYTMFEIAVFSIPSNFKLSAKGPGVSSLHSTIALTGTVAPGTKRRFTWRDEQFISGGAQPYYTTLMATNVFIKWAHGSGVSIGTRCTALDAFGSYVRKAENGSNWEYSLVQRTLNVGGVPGVGPFTETVFGPFSIAKNKLSANGERVVLISVDIGGTKSMLLYINGLSSSEFSPPAIVTGVGANLGFGSAGFENHVFDIDDSGGAFQVVEYGELFPLNSFTPNPDISDIVVYPFTRETGRGMHHPGPYMDPFDFNEPNNVWWQKDGRWRFRSGSSGNPSFYAFLCYWSATFTNYDYTVTAGIYGDNGVVVRFKNPFNYIAVRLIDTAATAELVIDIVVNGATIGATQTPVTYVAGAEIKVVVINNPVLNAADSNAVFLRCFYNGELIYPISGVYYVITDGQTQFGTGRPGLIRSSAVSGNNDESVANSFSIGRASTVSLPTTPSILSKSAEACVKVSATLIGSDFDDPDLGSSHAFSQWQVRLSPGGAAIFDSGQTASALSSITITPSSGTWSGVYATSPGLNALTDYEARVRYKDDVGLWSGWSSWFLFSVGNPSVTSSVVETIPNYPASPIPSQVFTEAIQFKTLISQFDSGKEQRRAKWTSGRRVFKLTYDPLERAQMDTIWDFYTDVGFGALNTFNFSHPVTGATYVCRFLSDSMSRETFEATLERGSLDLVQII